MLKKIAILISFYKLRKIVQSGNFRKYEECRIKTKISKLKNSKS